MVWISRRQYAASERIVSQCRLFLSRQQRKRLKTDLRNFHRRKCTPNALLRREEAGALIIQSVYRSFAVRNCLCNAGIIRGSSGNHALKESVIAVAHSVYIKRRFHERQSESDQLRHTTQLLQDLVSHHTANLDRKRLSYAMKLEITKLSLGKIRLEDDDKRTRLEARVGNYSQILAVVGDQMAYVTKLRAKSIALSERTVATFESIEQNFESIQSVLRFIDGPESNVTDNAGYYEWIKDERNAIDRRMIEYDMDQERILYEDQMRLDADIQSLLQSYDLYALKVEKIERLEGYEAEAYSLDIFIQSRPVEPSEVEKLTKWVGDNGAKMDRLEDALAGAFHKTHSFYCQQDAEMTKCVVFHEEDVSEPKAVVKSADMAISPFDSNSWMIVFKSEPWVRKLKNDAALKHFKAVQEHIRIRRNELLSNRDNRDTRNATDLQEVNIVPERDAIIRQASPLPRQAFMKSFKYGVDDIRQGLKVFRGRSEAILQPLSRIKLNQRRSRIAPPSTRRDPELRMMMINVKKNMFRQTHSSIAISSLQFTVGHGETDAMSYVNDGNASKGLPFYQSRMELGQHTQVVLWIQTSEKVDEFITNLAIGIDKDGHPDYHNQGYSLVGHQHLKGGLWIKRDVKSMHVISSLQVAYTNSTDSHVLQRDYEKIPCCLSAIGDCFAEGNLWISLEKRYARMSTFDVSRMKKELADYEEMLSKTPGDEMMQNIVDEMGRRVEIAKRKQEERRGIKTNNLEYITEFLVLEENNVQKLRKGFDTIGWNGSVVSVEDVIQHLKEVRSLAPLIEKLVAIILGQQNRTIHEMDFGEFARGFCSFAMLGRDEVVKITFSSIDDAGYGFIPKQAYIELLDVLDPKGTGIAFRALTEDVVLPDPMSFVAFEELNDKYPNALFPLFRFQQSVRDGFLGAKYWSRKMRKFHLAKELVLQNTEVSK